MPALESDVRTRDRMGGVTSSAANHSPALSVLFSPNKVNGRRVRNGCKSSDITPQLSTASAVSVAAAMKKKQNIRIEKGEGGRFAIGSTSFRTPRKKEKKRTLIVLVLCTE